MDLYQAATRGDTNAIWAAAEQGCNIDSPDIDGKTPLWFAVQYGQSDACRLLIARGANVKTQNFSILEVAVQRGHADVVALLWPHCEAEKEERSLESAISLGFHDIADFLIGTGEFDYQHSEADKTEFLMGDGFPKRDCAAFQEWENFLFFRREEQLHLNRLFFDYALLLSTKGDHNAGLRLAKLLLKEPNPMADVNCRIKINGRFETPLTAAAEAGNLEILAALIDCPATSLSICGKYNWPAFLHFLASPQSLSAEKGRTIAQKLSIKTLDDDHSWSVNWGTGFESGLEAAFKNVLQFGDDTLMKQVIEFVQGAAGISIVPLLIRANEPSGLRWILNRHNMHASEVPPILWALLCDYFLSHPDPDALRLFTQVAEFLVECAFWDCTILGYLYARKFSFLKEFFYLMHDSQATEETFAGLLQESTDKSLLDYRAD
jgi:ankyrin repeat protein